MPSKRFNNLNQIKKRSFLSKAHKEFALHSYEGASITRLVSDLKMAKGSIYQYFDDKKDLYRFLVEHAYTQLFKVLKKTCPPPKSSTEFDAWYKKFLMVYIKFLCAIPSYARLMERNKTDAINLLTYSLVDQMVANASQNTKSVANLYALKSLPFLIFNYILHTKKIDVDELIINDKSIEMHSDKLLYLCEAFLNRN